MNTKPAVRVRALALLRDHPELSSREVARRIGVSNKTVSRWRTNAGLEQQPARDVLSTHDLSALLVEQGVHIHARRIHRWTQQGLIVPLGLSVIGRRFIHVWPPTSVDQAREIERQLRRYRSSDHALIGLFARGYSVNEKCLLDAYRRTVIARANSLYDLQQTLTAIDDHSDDKDWDAFADAILHTFATGRQYKRLRRMRRFDERHLRTEERSLPGQFVQQQVMTFAAIFLQGRVGGDDEIRRMLTHARAGSLATRGSSLDEQVELAKQFQSRMSYGALMHTIDSTTLPTLSNERDDVLTIATVIEGIFIRPTIEMTPSLNAQHPRGLLGEWLEADPFSFGLILLFLVSMRQVTGFNEWFTELATIAKELLPELDETVSQIIELMAEEDGNDEPEAEA